MKSQKSKGVTLKHDYLGLDAASIRRSIGNHLVYTVGKDLYTAKDRDLYHTLAYTVRDRLIERWMETMRSCYRQDAKRVYYLSLEFLMGRTLTNSMLNMHMYDEACNALSDLGLDLDTLREIETDAALGNGGLGRLAACFLDSMATLRLPGYGYGIRYDYGMFTQRVDDGYQVEHPENWLRYGTPWEFPRAEVLYPVQFGGRVTTYHDAQGALRYEWGDAEQVMAMAFDTPIPGYGTNTVNNLRLWSAKATRDFELRYFNEGNYIKAVEEKNASENLSRVLYPDDTTFMGKELRLKQQYFFVSASLQDIVRRYLSAHDDFDVFPDKVAIQLNDTHPSIAIAELMRLLLDVHSQSWERAWDITRQTFAYTNHTLLPEALETWPVTLFERMLPRHLQIIYEINQRFLDEIRHRCPGDSDLVRRISLIDETGERRIRMAHLAIVGSHRVNGVSQVHTDLMKQTIFADFDRLYPQRIIAITNGVTPRRWLNQANRGLARLIRKHLGGGWVTDLDRLAELADLADDAGFRDDFYAVKLENKAQLSNQIKKHLGLVITPDSMFDVHVKRIHEYKRQLLNILHVITRYNRLRTGTDLDAPSRTVIFAGKAAPGYAFAKLIVKLITSVAEVVNSDPRVNDQLRVVFIPNYDVTTAADIIPAAELSEQISTAGTEASGTGNMKLALNGALTIGTLDGANIEIRDAVGEEHMFVFGLSPEQAAVTWQQGHDPWRYYHDNAELKEVLDMIASGYFSPTEPELFRPIFDALTCGGDRYLVLADYAAYIACQEQVDARYGDERRWLHSAILNVAHMGIFSSDRTVKDYAERVWGVEPVHHE
jgi:starch phosphorylase